MKKLLMITSFLGALTFSEVMAIQLKENNSKIQKIFTDKNIKGTFIVYDIENDKVIGYNKERSDIQFPPASTFKIFNSLIGLETGAVKDTDKVFYKYEGSKMYLKSWENDMNLKTGIKVSHVPAYQQLATMIGYDDMKKNIDNLNFGNKNIGTEKDLTTFWLQGPLKISAIEQAELLGKLASKKLNYSEEIQQEVINISKLDSGKNWTLYGKTGWGTKNVEVPVGWFVGWVNENGKNYSFAINMDTETADKLPLREEIAIKSLKAIGLLQK